MKRLWGCSYSFKWPEVQRGRNEADLQRELKVKSVRGNILLHPPCIPGPGSRPSQHVSALGSIIQ